MMQLGNTSVRFEENEERLKVEFPLRRNWPALVIYTILALLWGVGLVLFIYFLFVPPAPRGVNELPFALRLTWIIGVLLWLYVWSRYLGRLILRWWQYYLADRELLFVSKDRVIVRRPVSIFGITDAYAREHVAPFYYNDKYDCLAFQYGNVRHILFAQTLPAADRTSLLRFLNGRFFPNQSDDDDE